MIRGQFVAVGLAFACLPPPALAQQVVARDRTMNMTAQAGQELRVFTFASWNRDCSPLPAPQVAVVAPPAHGTLSVRPGQSTVSVLREGAPDCTGRTYHGTTVWYTPAPGYRGPDQFRYAITTTRGTSHDTVVVDVR